MRSSGRPLLLSLSCLVLALVVTACAPELDKLEPRRSARGTFGEEAYKAVCRRMAGTELPNDVAGKRSAALCLGDAATVQQTLVEASAAQLTPVDAPGTTMFEVSHADPLTPRLLALAERRAT